MSRRVFLMAQYRFEMTGRQSCIYLVAFLASFVLLQTGRSGTLVFFTPILLVHGTHELLSVVLLYVFCFYDEEKSVGTVCK